MRRFFWLIGLLLLSACSPPTFNNVDVTGADFGRDFSLTDPSGARRTLADYRGKVVAVFFGYTQCPDVCPTTLSDMAQVKKKLGPDGDKLQVIFITVDPERDTPQVLAQYVPGFDPSFIGLYGTSDEIAKTAKEFKVFYQKTPGKTPTSYTMDHSAGTFVYDKEGHLRLFLKQGGSVDSVAADLKKLM